MSRPRSQCIIRKSKTEEELKDTNSKKNEMIPNIPGLKVPKFTGKAKDFPSNTKKVRIMLTLAHSVS